MTETRHPAGHELQAFFDKELDQAAAEHIAEHCEQCAICRAELTEIERMGALLAATPTPELPRSVWHRVAMARQQKEVPLGRAFKWALTAACATGVALGLQLGPVKFRVEKSAVEQPSLALETIWGDGSSASLLSVYTANLD
jgi:anti-sigma factor RsiW